MSVLSSLPGPRVCILPQGFRLQLPPSWSRHICCPTTIASPICHLPAGSRRRRRTKPYRRISPYLADWDLEPNLSPSPTTARACLPVVATRMLHSIHRHPLTRIDFSTLTLTHLGLTPSGKSLRHSKDIASTSKHCQRPGALRNPEEPPQPPQKASLPVSGPIRYSETRAPQRRASIPVFQGSQRP